jgi:hypothetical protein
MSAREYVTLPVYIETRTESLINEVQIPKAEWDAMTHEQRERWAEDAAEATFRSVCSYGYDIGEVR